MHTKMWILLMAGVIVAAATPAGPTESTIYNFCSAANCADGGNPRSTLVGARSGSLYGTTASGGANSEGTVYQLQHSNGVWNEYVLHSFCSAPNCSDGSGPRSGLTIDGTGNLFGTTFIGGSTACYNGCGVVFELTPSNGGWTYTVIYSFLNGSDGSNPMENLTVDSSDNLYGATSSGGVNNNGTVFELSPSASTWNYNLIYSFGGFGGGSEPWGVTLDQFGNLYGTAQGGSSAFCSSLYYNNCGITFELTQSNGAWTESVLYSFCSIVNCTDGVYPGPRLVFDNVGNLYGTTAEGDKGGTVFELVPSNGTWQETVLYSFCSEAHCRDGAVPTGVTLNSKGELYGATTYGGGNGHANGYGTVFGLADSNGTWIEKTFHFNGNDGSMPLGGVLLNQGNLYGTTSEISEGEASGVAYEITP